jgi:hypothetical protein
MITRGWMLWVVHVDATADGRGDGGKVIFVGADNEVAAPEGAFDDGGVNDVGGAGAAGEDSGGPGLGVVETLDFASSQEPCELSLAGSSPPALGYHGSGDGPHDPAERRR